MITGGCCPAMSTQEVKALFCSPDRLWSALLALASQLPAQVKINLMVFAEQSAPASPAWQSQPRPARLRARPPPRPRAPQPPPAPSAGAPPRSVARPVRPQARQELASVAWTVQEHLLHLSFARHTEESPMHAWDARPHPAPMPRWHICCKQQPSRVQWQSQPWLLVCAPSSSPARRQCERRCSLQPPRLRLPQCRAAPLPRPLAHWPLARAPPPPPPAHAPRAARPDDLQIGLMHNL